MTREELKEQIDELMQQYELKFPETLRNQFIK